MNIKVTLLYFSPTKKQSEKNSSNKVKMKNEDSEINEITEDTRQRKTKYKQLWKYLCDSAVKKKQQTILECSSHILQLSSFIMQKKLKTYFFIWDKRTKEQLDSKMHRNSIRNQWITFAKKLNYKNYIPKFEIVQKKLTNARYIHTIKSQWIYLTRKITSISKYHQIKSIKNWFIFTSTIMNRLRNDAKSSNFKKAQLLSNWIRFNDSLISRFRTSAYNRMFYKNKLRTFVRKYVEMTQKQTFNRMYLQNTWISLSTNISKQQNMHNALLDIRSEFEVTFWLPLPQLYKLAIFKSLLSSKISALKQQRVKSTNRVRWIRWSCKIIWFQKINQMKYSQSKFSEKSMIMNRLKARKLRVDINHNNQNQDNNINSKNLDNQVTAALQNRVKLSKSDVKSFSRPQLDVKNYSMHKAESVDILDENGHKSPKELEIHKESTLILENENPLDLKNRSIQKDNDTLHDISVQNIRSVPSHDNSPIDVDLDSNFKTVKVDNPNMIINIYNYPPGYQSGSSMSISRNLTPKSRRYVSIAKQSDEDADESSDSEIEPSFVVEGEKIENSSPIPTYAQISPRRQRISKNSTSILNDSSEWEYKSFSSHLQN